jgi:hypothetical protein
MNEVVCHYRHAGQMSLLSLSAGCERQVNDLGLQVSVRIDRQQPNRHRQFEPRGPHDPGLKYSTPFFV